MQKLFSLKRGVGVTALLLAAVLSVSGCGSKDLSSTGSDYGSEPEQTLLVSEENTESVLDGTKDNSSTASKNGGSTQTVNNSKTASTGSKIPAATAGKTTFDANPYANIPQSVKSKGVHVLMWRDYTPLEQQLINSFQQKTGMKVRTTKTTEDAYSTKLMSMVSGSDSPDVVLIGSTNFPGLALRALQVMDPSVYRLDDSFWYKTYMDVFKANGKYFAVSARGPWATEDTNYVTYYKPAVLKMAGISEDPFALYKQGKWDWEKQKEMATRVKQKGNGYIGISFQSQDVMMYSAGVDFVTYDGKQFASALDNAATASVVTKAWQQVATYQNNGLSSGWSLNNVIQGKVAFFNAISYGMYDAEADDWFSDVAHTSNDLRAVPIAGPTAGNSYTPVAVKGWGTAKNAKNPEGAAYFLRYFLDVNNCDMNSSFYNEQFREVYNTVTAKSAKKAIMRGRGVINYVGADTYGTICNNLLNATSEQVTNVLNTSKNQMQVGMTRANKELKKIG